MDDIDTDMIETALVVNSIVSALIMFLFILFTKSPDDLIMPIYIGIIAFVVLVVAEILCWLFHIPAWICKGLTWIHDKTEPKE